MGADVPDSHLSHLGSSPVQAAEEVADQPARLAAEESTKSGFSWARCVEVLSLLAAPLLIVWPLRAQLFSSERMIDPYLHTAVIRNGRELINMFGADDRQHVRVGAVLPGHLAYELFGAVPGWFAVRYLFVLLATVPAYLLFRRLWGIGAGALVVAAILASPVIVRAWGTDYPDSAAVSYLFAGIAALVMPTKSTKSRWGWIVFAGSMLTLALHSNFITAPLIVCAVAGYAIVYFRLGWRRLLSEGLVLIGCFVVVSALLSLWMWASFGVTDLFSPTIAALKDIQSPAQLAKWHSSTNRWFLDEPYLLIPGVGILAWVGHWLFTKREASRVEKAVVLITAFQVLMFAFEQFFAKQWTLEYIYYSSTLWPGAILVMALVVRRLASSLLAKPMTAWLPATLVIATAVVISEFQLKIHFVDRPWGFLLSALIVVVSVLAVLLGRWRVTAFAVALIVIAGNFLITIATPEKFRHYPGQTFYPAAEYDKVFKTDYQEPMEHFQISDKFLRLIPKGRTLRIWTTKSPNHLLNDMGAQFSWADSKAGIALPKVNAGEITGLRKKKTDLLILLSPTGKEFPATMAALQKNSIAYTSINRATLTAGSTTMQVWTVDLDWR